MRAKSRIEEGDRVAICGLAIYDVYNDRTVLQINPRLEEKNRILEGSEIQLSYSDEVLDHVFIPAKAGDTLTANTVIKNIAERSGATGKMAFLITETTYTNQNDELVAKARATTIHR